MNVSQGIGGACLAAAARASEGVLNRERDARYPGYPSVSGGSLLRQYALIDTHVEGTSFCGAKQQPLLRFVKNRRSFLMFLLNIH